MKKILYSMFALMIAALTFTSCEDVPAPYEIPGGNGDNPGDNTELHTIYSETFDNNKTYFSFKNVSLSDGLSYVWKVSSYNNNGYLNASAFASNASHASEAWAISPAIDLSDSKKATATFTHAINKLTDPTNNMKQFMTLWASTDYNGDVKTATWKQIEIPTYPAGDKWSFVSAGDIDATEYCGKKVYFGFKYTSTNENSGGWEIDNFEVKGDGTAMETPETPDTPDTPSTEPTGEGTKESPYNVAAAVKYITDGGDATKEVYVKGKVSTVKKFNDNYGSINYYISDDGTTTNEFYVYSGNNLGNVKFTSLDELKVGDEVVICGKLKEYNGTKEFDSRNYLVSLNGKTSGGDTPDTPAEGKNLLVNGDCETWADGIPTNWKTTSSAGNATLTQSTDAHAGSYSISVGFNEKQNKRLGYKEITLKAGTYTFSYYAKATTAEKSQTHGGYVPVTDGKVGSYVYDSKYAELNSTSWTLVTYEFTLKETTTICLIILNPKTSTYATAQNILVDDASLVTANGGLAE